MINQGKIVYRLRAVLSEPTLSLKLHLFLAFVSLVLFGLFGLYYSIANIRKNWAQYEVLRAEEYTLQGNKFDLLEAKETLIKAEPYLEKLNESVPDNADLHLYLPILANKAGSAGYVLTDYSSSLILPESVSIGSIYKGDIMNSYQFFEEIERAPRPANVQYIEATFDPEKDIVKTKAEFSIYYVPYNVLDLAMPLGGKIDLEFLRKEFSTANE